MFQRQNEEERNKWDYYELKRGHDVMITAPDELFRMMLNIISKDDELVLSLPSLFDIV